MNNKQLKVSVELGLSALCKHAQPGQTLSHRDIADVCECSKSLIWLIEDCAIKKIKRHKLSEKLVSYHETI